LFWGTRGTGGPGGQYFAAQAFPEVIEEANKYLAGQIILEEKTAAELKVNQEAKAATELKAKQEAIAKTTTLKKTTIRCIKGKLVKKVTAVKPVCPKGYKKK
jgi:hypothetical protein